MSNKLLQIENTVQIRNLSNSRVVSRNIRVLFLVLALVLDFLTVFAFYQTRPVYIINIGSAGDSWYIDNFYSPESNAQGIYRWSGGVSSITLPAVGSPFQVTLDAQAYRPADSPPVSFELALSNPTQTMTYQGVNQEQKYLLTVNAKLDLSPDKHILTITSPTFQPSKTDDRKLGLLVKQISIQALPDSPGFVIPPILAWLSLGAGILLTQLLVLIGLLKSRQRRPYLISGGIAGGILAGLLVIGLAYPTAALENAYSVGVGLVAFGLTGLVFWRWRKWGPLFGALILAGMTLGVLFNLFSFVALAVGCVGAILLALIYNPRLSRTGYNLLIVAYVSILPSWGLLQQHFISTVDGESHHLYWLNELNLLVKEGDLFPRWAPDFSFGRGNTVFTFYAPLSRYLGEFFILGGLTPAFAFLAALVAMSTASGLAMYYLSRDFMGGPGAIVAAVAYLYHPYRLADLYQRGDIAEALNFVFFPLAFLAVSRTLRFNQPVRLTTLIGGGAAFGLMFISHQLTAFYFGVFVLAPFILLVFLRQIWINRRSLTITLRLIGIRLLWLAGMAALGFALSAFYLLPVLLESKNIRVGNKVAISWGYGFLDDKAINWKDWFSSILPPAYDNKAMTNLVWFGPTFLLLGLFGLVTLWLPSKRNRRQNQKKKHLYTRWLALSFGLIIIFLLVMQLKFTEPFWENFPGMVYIQFPWRLMIFVALMVSVLIGFLAESLIRTARQFARWLSVRSLFVGPSSFSLLRSGPHLKTVRKFAFYSSGIVEIGLLGLLMGYSGAGKVSLQYYPTSFSGIYSRGTLINQLDNGDIFYLPNWARSLDTVEKEPDNAFIVRDGKTQSDSVEFKRLASSHYQLQLNLAQPGVLVIPIFYFEGWNLKANGQDLPLSYNQPQGYIQATVPAGNYSVDLQFQNSLPATAGIALTLLTLLLVVGIIGRKFLFRLRLKSKTKLTSSV